MKRSKTKHGIFQTEVAKFEVWYAGKYIGYETNLEYATNRFKAYLKLYGPK